MRLPVRMCALVLWEYVYSRMQLCSRECMFLFLRPVWGPCNLARIISVSVHNLARALPYHLRAVASCYVYVCDKTLHVFENVRGAVGSVV